MTDPDLAFKASVACSNPTCGLQGQWHRIPADRDHPTLCGGCQSVLHCDHQEVTTAVYAGTLKDPLRIETVKCHRCHTELRRTPFKITLDEVPLALLHAVHQS